MATWRKSISGSENSQCKGPGVVSVPYVGRASRRLTWWDCGGRKRRGEWWQMRSGDNRPRSLQTQTRPVVMQANHTWNPVHTPGLPLASPGLPHPGPRAKPEQQPYREECLPPHPYQLLCLLVDFENKMWSQGLWKEEVCQCSGDKLLHPAQDVSAQEVCPGSEPLGAVFGRQELSWAPQPGFPFSL